jgi:uncharacterized membrane protein YhaH (DUF805 family)
MFTGRINKQDFWKAWGYLTLATLGIIAAFFILTVATQGLFFVGADFHFYLFGQRFWVEGLDIFVWTVFPLYFLSLAGLFARRLHDTGRSSWLWGMLFVSVILLFVFREDLISTFSNTPIVAIPLLILSWPITLLSITLVATIRVLFLSSQPGVQGQNTYGSPTTYRSVRAAVFGKK